MKVSVIVPVFNPGECLDKLVDSLLGQSLPDVEAIFVDDGSTDGTAERLTALAAEHERVRVRQLANSGGPGRPRNAGLELACGEFVFFADHDDWLGREALERLYATAVADEADVVIGKVVGHGGKRVPRKVFAQNRHRLTASPLLFELLAPHKLFRRAFLDEHGLRFPEPERPLEDHLVVVPALLRARAVSIVADYPCYHWVRRADGQNASLQRRDVEAYYAAVADVLRIVDAHTAPGAERDRLYLRWYRGKLLSRIGTRASLRRPDDERAQVLAVGRALTQERFPPHLDARLPYVDRLRAALLRRGAGDALEALAHYDASLRAVVNLRRIQGDGTWLTLHLGGRLRRTEGRQPPGFLREDERLRFDAPEPLRTLLQPDETDATGALSDDRWGVLLRSVEDGTTWELPAEAHVKLLDGEDGRLAPRLRIKARVAPTIAAGGAPLAPGRYQVVVIVAIGGLHATTALQRDGEPFTITVSAAHRLEHSGLRRPPRPQTPLRRLARRTPGAAAAVRRARRALRVR